MYVKKSINLRLEYRGCSMKMKSYFNVNLEFNHQRLHNQIEQAITSKSKGFICVVDANVLTISRDDLQYREILNSSIVNTCDGSSIAMLAGLIHKQKLRALNGPDIFANYIEKYYKQLLLGSTVEISNKIKNTLESKNISSSHLNVMPLPFLPVDNFDYLSIAKEINELNPDIIWVSLGAPKQERFMSKLLPYLDRGVMFGIGAAFSFYVGDLGMPKISIGGLKVIWLNRLFNEPIKVIKRIIPAILIIPILYFEEKRRYNT